MDGFNAYLDMAQTRMYISLVGDQFRMDVSRGGGFLRNLIAWGVLNPPPFFKMVCGGVLRVFFDADTPFVRKKILVVFFWTAHPKFCPCPQFSRHDVFHSGGGGGWGAGVPFRGQYPRTAKNPLKTPPQTSPFFLNLALGWFLSMISDFRETPLPWT